jgi:hypothetical protein
MMPPLWVTCAQPPTRDQPLQVIAVTTPSDTTALHVKRKTVVPAQHTLLAAIFQSQGLFVWFHLCCAVHSFLFQLASVAPLPKHTHRA